MSSSPTLTTPGSLTASSPCPWRLSVCTHVHVLLRGSDPHPADRMRSLRSNTPRMSPASAHDDDVLAYLNRLDVQCNVWCRSPADVADALGRCHVPDAQTHIHQRRRLPCAHRVCFSHPTRVGATVPASFQDYSHHGVLLSEQGMAAAPIRTYVQSPHCPGSHAQLLGAGPACVWTTPIATQGSCRVAQLIALDGFTGMYEKRSSGIMTTYVRMYVHPHDRRRACRPDQCGPRCGMGNADQPSNLTHVQRSELHSSWTCLVTEGEVPVPVHYHRGGSSPQISLNDATVRVLAESALAKARVLTYWAL